MARRTVKAWARRWNGNRELSGYHGPEIALKPSHFENEPLYHDTTIIPVTVTYDDGKAKRRKR